MIQAFVVTDRHFAVRFGRDDGPNAALLAIIADRIGVVGLVGDEGVRLLLGKLDQRVVRLAVGRFTRREVEGNGPALLPRPSKRRLQLRED
jgi:hypothetical protein